MNDLLKVIINFIKKHPMRYLVSFILMIGSSIAAVYPARIIGQVVDKIVASELNAEWLGTQLVVLVGIILVAYITESIWTYYIFIGHYEIQKELRVIISPVLKCAYNGIFFLKLFRSNFTRSSF